MSVNLYGPRSGVVPAAQPSKWVQLAIIHTYEKETHVVHLPRQASAQ